MPLTKITKEEIDRFHVAVRSGRVDTVEEILRKKDAKAKAKLLKKKTASGNPPLILAVNHDKQEMLQFLLDQDGIELEACDVQGNTAIMRAVSQGSYPMVELLRQYGASIKAQRPGVPTPLTLATGSPEKSNQQIIDYLVAEERDERSEEDEATATDSPSTSPATLAEPPTPTQPSLAEAVKARSPVAMPIKAAFFASAPKAAVLDAKAMKKYFQIEESASWFTPVHKEAAQMPYNIVLAQSSVDDIMRKIFRISPKKTMTDQDWHEQFILPRQFGSNKASPLLHFIAQGQSALLKEALRLGNYAPEQLRELIRIPLPYQGACLTMLEMVVLNKQSACSEALRVHALIPAKQWSKVVAIVEQEVQQKTAASEQICSRPAR